MPSPEYIAERFDELTTEVLAPLVLGGQLRPVRPFGVEMALMVGAGRSITDADLRSRIDVARVRVARLIAPVDTLPEPSSYDWALCAALNDLIQVTNHELGGALTRGRHLRLLGSVMALCDRIPPPRTIGAALSRHATFARVLECVRTDSTVSWWTGQASFRGQAAPGRLLAWPRLRNVQVDARRVSLTDMIEGIPGVSEEEFARAVRLWLSRTPLTDIGTLGRRSPAFVWSEPAIALIATAPGRALAYRLLARQGREITLAVLARAAKEIPESAGEARAICEAFAGEVAEGLKLHGAGAASGR